MVARNIANALEDTDIASIARLQDDILDESYDTLGIVFPVYWGGLPLKVLEFLPALKKHQDSYIFGVVTHAGGPGQALPHLAFELQKIGLELTAGFYLRMPSNYILSYDAPTKSSIQTHLERADHTITEMVDTIRNKKINQSEVSSYSGGSSSYQRFIADVQHSDEKFWIDDSCTECELCVRVCPVQNIHLKDGRPEWLHHCEQCLACINWCPESAIQFGTGTEHSGRYTNPRVKIEDLEI